MQYSLEAFIAIVRAHMSVKNEIEARDTVFRMKLNIEIKRKKTPWFALEREGFRQEEFDAWSSLHTNKLTEKETIEKVTDLMELYYEKAYPL